MVKRVEELIKKYSLAPLEREGGYFSFLSRFGENSGCIFYLITKDSFSSLHSLKTDEIWFFLEGGKAEQVLFDEENIERRILSQDNRFSLVKAGVYQATKLVEGDYAFFSTVMSPRFKEEDFILMDDEIFSFFPELEEYKR